MRKRAAVVAVVVTLIVAGMIATGLYVQRRGENSATSAADRVLVAVTARLSDPVARSSAPITAAFLLAVAGPGVDVVVRLPDGRTVVATQAEGGRVYAHEAVATDGTRVTAYARLSGVWMYYVAVGSILLVSGAVVAYVVGSSRRRDRRVVAALDELERVAASMGSFPVVPAPATFGIAEVDRVAERLRDSNERLARVVEAERRLVSDVSHQLRTPLTALGLRLEELAAQADDATVVREETAAAQRQVERLTAVVADLVALHREGAAAGDAVIDVDDLVISVAREWAPLYLARGRTLLRAGVTELRARARGGAAAQVLSALVDNALQHGAGTVVVRTRRSAGWVVIEVSDQGPGIATAIGGRVFERGVTTGSGQGLGLSLARRLAEAEGGRLELLSTAPPVLGLFLPVAPQEGETDC
ncbi:MAG: HAMP domain-containing histidine kinase [Actinomycetota bacterium]|nr:MAG: HAMP domain-containing histidine kinase [Actinomycetota bacterium]